VTVLKVADSKEPQIAALTGLLERPDLDPRTQKRIRDEIWAIRGGVQGEKEAAYEIDFHYADSDSHMVIHDLRLEFGGRVAQIDHLIMNRILDVWVCETKAFSEGVKIDDYGEWYRYGGGRAYGMPSPVKQNAHHVAVLQHIFAKGGVRLPRRIVTIRPSVFPVILISNNARIDRPKRKKAAEAIEGLDTVIKVERLVETIERSVDARNPVPVMAKFVGKETVKDLADQLVALHRPGAFDWAGKFGLPPKLSTAPTTPKQIVEDPGSVEGAGGSCASCGKSVSEKVGAYSRAHADRFGGETLCFDCQRSASRSKSGRANRP
jgi:Nuclease-related domain